MTDSELQHQVVNQVWRDVCIQVSSRVMNLIQDQSWEQVDVLTRGTIWHQMQYEIRVSVNDEVGSVNQLRYD